MDTRKAILGPPWVVTVKDVPALPMAGVVDRKNIPDISR